MKKIICMGEMLIDFIGEKQSANLSKQSTFQMKAGGAPANVACVIGALGGQSCFYGAVGCDGFGDFLKETLKKYQVNLEGLIRVNDPTTLAFVSLADQGERDFVFYRGADAHLSYEAIALSLNQEDSLYHFGAATGFLEGLLKETYVKILEKSSDVGRFISFDPNYRSAFWSKDQKTFINYCEMFLSKANLVKLSEEEAQMIAGEKDLEKVMEMLKKAYRATFVITLGSKGALVFNENWKLLVQAPKVKAIDTTGAGDAFIGALLRFISDFNKPIDVVQSEELMFELVKKANEVAARVCTEYGALTALENMKEA